MKLQEIFEGEDLKAQMRELNKELIAAKSGGNDDVAEQLALDIAELKELIKDKSA